MQAFQFDLEIGAKVREEERRPVPEKPQVGELPLEHVPDEDPGGQGEWSDAERRQQHVCGRVIILSSFLTCVCSQPFTLQTNVISINIPRYVFTASTRSMWLRYQE